MNDKHPVNVFNGLKFKKDKLSNASETKKPSHLVPISAYKNSFNIVKPFIKPISKIY